MKKLIKVLLFVSIINLFSGIVYAGIIDLPEPDSIDPTILTMGTTTN